MPLAKSTAGREVQQFVIGDRKQAGYLEEQGMKTGQEQAGSITAWQIGKQKCSQPNECLASLRRRSGTESVKVQSLNAGAN